MKFPFIYFLVNWVRLQGGCTWVVWRLWYHLVSDTVDTSCSQFWNLDWLSKPLTCFRIILHSEKVSMFKSAPLLLLHVEILSAPDQPCWNQLVMKFSMFSRVGIVLDDITKSFHGVCTQGRNFSCLIEWVVQSQLLRKSRVHSAKLKRWSTPAAINPVRQCKIFCEQVADRYSAIKSMRFLTCSLIISPALGLRFQWLQINRPRTTSLSTTWPTR